jgi:photosystem II stability/assembly factor-like uncharacterized protein
MKNFVYLILVSIIYTTSIVAQNFWENKGLNGITVYDITVDGEGNIYAATSDSGIYRSSNNGMSWQQSNTGLTSLNVWTIKVFSNHSDIIWAGTQDMGLFKSTDLGGSWILSGLPEWVSELTSNSNGDIFASTISDGIYRSTDAGNNWESVSDPMQVGNDVYSINVNTNDDIFAGTDAHMFQSTDAGNSWIQIDNGLVVTGVIWSIAFNLSGDVFAGDGGGFFTGVGSVYRSIDNGNNWSQTMMTNRSVIAMTTISDSIIYAGTDLGVYVSYDNGNSGEQINSGLTESLIYSLSLDKSGHLFAGTNNGIFRSTDALTFIDEDHKDLPLNFTLSQNYPNPFNPSSKISWQSPVGSHQTLKVYDLLGREVATLVDEFRPAGSYEVKFDAENLTSGIYLYKLQVGSNTETRKMVLMK